MLIDKLVFNNIRQKFSYIIVTKTGFIEKNITDGCVTESHSPNLTESHIHNNAQNSIKCCLIWSNYHELLLKKTQSVDR